MNLRKLILIVAVVVAVLLLLVNVASISMRSHAAQKMRQAGYRAEVSPLTLPLDTVGAGEAVSCTVLVRNLGTQTWSAQGSEEHYIALGQYQRRWIDVLTSREGHGNNPQSRLQLDKPLPPGDAWVAHINFNAPTKPGLYHMRLQMVKEGVGWFGGTIAFDLQVTGAAGETPRHLPHFF